MVGTTVATLTYIVNPLTFTVDLQEIVVNQLITVMFVNLKDMLKPMIGSLIQLTHQI